MPWLLSWKRWHLLVSLVSAPALVLSDSVVEPADRLIGMKSHIMILAKKFRFHWECFKW